MKTNLILFTVDYYPSTSCGGIGIHVYNLANQLKHQYNVTVVYGKYSSDNGEKTSISTVDDIRVIKVATRYNELQKYNSIGDFDLNLMVCAGLDYYITSELDKYINFKDKNTILHNHFYAFALTCEFLKYKYGLPLITTFHFLNWKTINDLNKTLLHSLLHASDICIFVSQWLKDSLEHLDMQYTEKSIIIHNGVYQSEYIETDNNMTNSIKICCISALIPSKRVDILLNSIPKMKYRDLVELEIAGNGDEIIPLMRLRMKNKLNVKFHGHIPHHEVLKLIHNSNLVVLPSIEEAFCISALETLAEGRVLIASNIAGFREIIHDYYNGILFYNSEDLALKLDYIYENPNILSNISRGALETSQIYLWHKIADLVISQYDKALTNRFNST